MAVAPEGRNYIEKGEKKKKANYRSCSIGAQINNSFWLRKAT